MIPKPCEHDNSIQDMTQFKSLEKNNKQMSHNIKQNEEHIYKRINLLGLNTPRPKGMMMTYGIIMNDGISNSEFPSLIFSCLGKMVIFLFVIHISSL